MRFKRPSEGGVVQTFSFQKSSSTKSMICAPSCPKTGSPSVVKRGFSFRVFDEVIASIPAMKASASTDTPTKHHSSVTM